MLKAANRGNAVEKTSYDDYYLDATWLAGPTGTDVADTRPELPFRQPGEGPQGRTTIISAEEQVGMHVHVGMPLAIVCLQTRQSHVAGFSWEGRGGGCELAGAPCWASTGC